jgi:hypothetical protein
VTLRSQRIILDRYSKIDHRDRILCSDDQLNRNNRSALNKIRDQLAKGQKTNSDLRLIYTDFLYCFFELQDMITWPSIKQKNDRNKSSQS